VHNWYTLLYLEPAVSAWRLYMLGLTMGAERDQLEDICRRLSFSERELRDFLTLRDHLGEALAKLMNWQEGTSSMSDIYFVLDQLPLEGVLFLMARSRREVMRKNISQYLTRLRSQELLIDGADLKALGLRDGPGFARILRRVRAAAVDGAATTREKQLELAKTLVETLRTDGTEEPRRMRERKPRQ